jgi:branched-chain amino acid transport system permease protein
MNLTKIKTSIIIVAVIGVVLYFVETRLGGFNLQLVRLVGINSIIAIGVNITNGYTNIFSLGFGGIMLVAAYSSILFTMPVAYKEAALHLPIWLEQAQLPFLPAMLLAAVLGVLTSVVLVFPAFRLRGHYFILASIGINIVIANLAENMHDYTQGSHGLRNVPAYTDSWWIYGILFLTIFFVWRLMHSKYGRALISISKDQKLAAVMGIDIVRYKIYSFIIGSFIVAIGGVLWVHLIQCINPQAFNLMFVFELIAMLAIGGIGTISGAILGATIVTLFTQAAAPIQEGFILFSLEIPPMYGLVNLLMAIIIIMIMIYRPDGIMRGRELSLELVSKWFKSSSEIVEK